MLIMWTTYSTIICYTSVHIAQYLIFLFLISQNQCTAGNVVQLIKKKAKIQQIKKSANTNRKALSELDIQRTFKV